MRTVMQSNLSKTSHSFPLAAAIRVSSSKPMCITSATYHLHTPKSQSLPTGSHPKPLINPLCAQFATSPHGFGWKSCKVFNFVKNTKHLGGLQCKSVGMGGVAGSRNGSVWSGIRIRSDGCCGSVVRGRSFSSSYSEKAGERSRVVRAKEVLPWLSSGKVNEAKGPTKWKGARSNSSTWEESVKRFNKGAVTKTAPSSWEVLAGTDEEKKNNLIVVKEGGDRKVDSEKERGNGYVNDERDDVVEGEEEEGLEVVDDPRWDKIHSGVGAMIGVKYRSVKPEFQRWNKQENWGRKTWKEATESTIPKIVGEGVYGVGPVLAALSAGRREFYALYVQEGLDLSGNNKKKKDKKGFEKVLRMAQKMGLSIKELSKHDLNMIVDNRPHQGIVLDTSQLEMVKIMELDPISSDEDRGSLWVALDEVTDPQNLGAIIRSAYFFGVAGVVLCAKNSAPLSGVVSKASAGSLEVMELRYCKNMMQFLVSSAENGWRVLGGSVSSRAVPLDEVLPGEPTILVLGSEGTGLRPLVERSCTQLVRIPGNIPVDVTMEGGNVLEGQQTNLECFSEEFRSFMAVESLNVSVAAGVLLHHLTGKNHNDNHGIADTSTHVLE